MAFTFQRVHVFPWEAIGTPLCLMPNQVLHVYMEAGQEALEN